MEKVVIKIGLIEPTEKEKKLFSEDTK